MADEGLEYEIPPSHSEPANSETEPLLSPTQSTFEKFRDGRETHQPSRWIRLTLAAFEVCFCLLGLWGHRAWNNIPRVLLVIVCVYYLISVTVCWPLQPCSNNRNLTEPDKRKCHINEMLLMGDVTLAMASILSCLSFIFCCAATKCKELVLFSPSEPRDIDKADIFILFLAFLITNVLLAVSFVFSYLIDFSASPPLPDNLFCNKGSSTIHVTFFFLQWVSLNICHIFAACCFALGTFAQDARRIIREVQNGTLNKVIRIHEDLCTVVFSTVSAYSVWFVVHWFTNGLCVMIFILEFLLFDEKVATLDVVYQVFLLVYFLCLFLFPCVCAARITSKCAGIYEKINCTTSGDWNEGHPFRDRHNIALFIFYAEKRRCGFKVGRITFDTSLTWVSFFIGFLSMLQSLIQHRYSYGFD